jgi:hypothetical protein
MTCTCITEGPTDGELCVLLGYSVRVVMAIRARVSHCRMHVHEQAYVFL